VRPALLWFRRDLRLDDHAGLALAAAEGRPAVPVFIRDMSVTTLAAAPLFRLGLALETFGAELAGQGMRLTLRSGEALAVLSDLIAETGADLVIWQRRYDPAGMATDSAVKAALKERGIRVESVPGFLLREPWEVQTAEARPFKVFTPFWRALQGKGVNPALHAIHEMHRTTDWPDSENLNDWSCVRPMFRAAPLLAHHQSVGEAAALDRLMRFREDAAGYSANRDQLALEATSHLSAALAVGEITPRRIWSALQDVPGGEAVQRQLAWRDFAWNLTYHTPSLLTGNWRREWDAFPWRSDNADAEAWRWGQTGIDLVDAAMRELWITGRMHNRARMIVASYLTKHLMTDWRVGRDWFEHTLTDWDAANNAMGWQWVAGSGPDAAPYFRVFNPDTQAEKFDPNGIYRAKWLNHPDFAAMVPMSKGVPKRPATPVVSLPEGRERALVAHSAFRASRSAPVT
jgi:deoxyribodipyrimidine photo-lyase